MSQGKERKGKERKGKERKGKERKERKGKERKGKERGLRRAPVQHDANHVAGDGINMYHKTLALMQEAIATCKQKHAEIWAGKIPYDSAASAL